MAVPLLATKLFLPPARAGRVQRERLLARLADLLRPGARLGLISAPAGFGKTSLLAEWLSRQALPAAWLALDAGDNSPEQFLAYLSAALERARPGLLPETNALLRAQPPAPLDMLLASLVNELAALPPDPPLVAALDDFQFVTSAEVRQAVAFLVEHTPPGLRLVIATRSDPPLPLARLRARGQMVELRAADLRFNTAEAAEFLAQALDLDPDARHETAAALNERTEGWAAGLQMAGLALKSAPGSDPRRLAQSFSGSHRFVLDYLGEEVLSRLPGEMERFLSRTVVLERFNAALCAALVCEQDDPAAVERSQAMLEELERSNLFLVPLDAERGWFRYHHLFADLLRTRLKQSAPGLAAGLHRRAAGWFETNGLPAEAIYHWLAAAQETPNAAAGDYTRAAELVERNTIALFRRGELHGLEHWVSLLPRELAEQRPWLCLYRAWICNFSGRLPEVEPLLRKAEAQRSLLSDGEQSELTGQLAAVRCQMAVVSPNPDPVFDLARVAAENLPEGTWARGVCRWAEAFVLRGWGELFRAEAMFAEQVRADSASGDSWGLAMSATDLGIVLRLQGRVRDAAQVCRQALETEQALGARRYGYTGRLLTALAAALYDLNELDEAARLLEEAVELNQRWRNPNHLVYSYINLARVRAAQGQFEQASSLLDSAGQVLRAMPVLAALNWAQEGARLYLRLRQGQPAHAGPAAEDQTNTALREEDAAQPFREVRETRQMHAARLLLARRRPAEALRLVQAVELTARQKGRGMALIEALAIKALALHESGAPEQARRALDEAATRAEPDGILRPIADPAVLSPEAARQLLNSLRASPLKAGPGFVERLLAALPELPGAAQAQAAPTTASQPPVRLVEPLSEREMDVLRLLADGLTNAQIAARLVITTGTVKAHTAAIYRKLDAANRTQAVALAREYRLI